MMTGMDSQFIANLISGVSAAAAIASAIFAGWQVIGSKAAKAKTDTAHKAALDMSDAAKRSAKVTEERTRQAKSRSSRCRRLSPNSRANPSHSLRLRLTYGALNSS